ncbi:hypothetical protein J6590_061741 [Homalodisca vitripennis]|nr:hypothetical protein J6590_061741 [Homalodisca vitripennis]
MTTTGKSARAVPQRPADPQPTPDINISPTAHPLAHFVIVVDVGPKRPLLESTRRKSPLFSTPKMCLIRSGKIQLTLI